MIGNTLSVNRNSFTISRPNLGMRSTVTDLSTQLCCKLKYYTEFVIPPALHGQRLSIGAIGRGFQFPGPGVPLPSFRGPASIPQIRFPPAFLFAARGIPMPTGMHVPCVYCVLMNCMVILYYFNFHACHCVNVTAWLPTGMHQMCIL